MAPEWREKRRRRRDPDLSPMADLYVRLFTEALAPEVDPAEQEARRQALWDLGTGMRRPGRGQHEGTNPDVTSMANLIRLVLDEKIDGRSSSHRD